MLNLTDDIAVGSLVLMLCSLLLASVTAPGSVTTNRIAAAPVVYMLLALLFALLFDTLECVLPGAFVMGPQPSPLTLAGARFFYLSVMILTSVGFGDMAPCIRSPNHWS